MVICCKPTNINLQLLEVILIFLSDIGSKSHIHVTQSCSSEQRRADTLLKQLQFLREDSMTCAFFTKAKHRLDIILLPLNVKTIGNWLDLRTLISSVFHAVNYELLLFKVLLIEECSFICCNSLIVFC